MDEQEWKWEREDPATIERVSYGPEDHGVFTCSVHLGAEGWGQAFGNLALDREASGPSFVRGLCAAFGVTDPEALVGQRCTALYAFDRYNEPIEAIRGPRGTFSLHAWRRSLDPSAPSLVAARLGDLERQCALAQRSANDARARLEAFVSRYGRF